jgi:hypothetical protein
MKFLQTDFLEVLLKLKLINISGGKEWKFRRFFVRSNGDISSSRYFSTIYMKIDGLVLERSVWANFIRAPRR